ncbi:MAG TPA: hypothetical protein VJL80_06505 [Aeromicrobium sp.]|nr:hypothetical protein [Aeromicrobium sp.]HKY57670.1 hypothetical protein [Aeromicrobium sp.]
MDLTLRNDTAKVVRLADRDLSRLWRLVADGASAETALRDLLPAIIEQYGAAGGALAAEWYDAQREKADVKGRFEALPIEPNDRGAQSLVGWALATAQDDQTLQALILGGVQRRIADHARYTVTSSSIADPAARGWQRVGAGECAFCREMIAKGAVYTRDTVDFGSHDHCNCSAVPAWGGQPIPVKPYTPSLRFKTDEARAAHNKRTREWLNQNT